MAEPHQSDALKKLVWFLVGLAILGTIIALVVYYAVELPAQQALLHAPALNEISGYSPPVIFASSVRGEPG